MLKLKEFLFQTFVVTGITVFPISNCSAQSYAVKTGVGIQDLIFAGFEFTPGKSNTSFEYRHGIAQFGANQTDHAMQFAVKHHFGGKSEYTWVKPWYLRPGINIYTESKYKSFFSPAYVYVVPDLRIGLESNLSRKFTIAWELGVAYVEDLYLIAFFPSVSISLQYRIKG